MLLMKKHELNDIMDEKSISQASKIHDFSEKWIHKFLNDVFGFFAHLFFIRFWQYKLFFIYALSICKWTKYTKKKNIKNGVESYVILEDNKNESV